MESQALIMLIVAILMIWGGLALAIVNLVRHPEDPNSPATRYGNDDE